MAQIHTGEPITVKNQEQEVTRQFNDTAPHLGIEEQERNALEGDGKNIPTEIKIIPVRWHENPKVEKFAMWNNNSAMDHYELDEYTDLSSSGKKLSLDGNFGRGEKAAMLPYNPHGLVWISCKNGNVHMIKLGANQSSNTGEYTFVKAHPYEGHPCPYTNKKTVIRLLDKEKGVVQEDIWPTLIEQWPDLLDTSNDWTLKVALGSSDDQWTIVDPYNGFAKAPKNNYWSMVYTYRRFFRINEKTRIQFYGSTNSLKPKDAKAKKKVDPSIRETFKTMETVFQDANNDPDSLFKMQTESVKSANFSIPLKITYIHDPDKSDGNENDTTGKRYSWDKSNKITGAQWSGVIYKNEIYARRSTENHTHQPLMGALGIHTSTKNFSVFVELDDNAPVTSDSDRQHINWKYLGESSFYSRETVKLDDFIDDITENMPQWFKDAIANMKRNSGKLEDDADKALQDLWNSKLTRNKDISNAEKERRNKKTNTNTNTDDDSDDEEEVKLKKKRKPKKKQPLTMPIAGAGSNVKAPKVIIIQSLKELREDYPQLVDKAVEYIEDASGSRLIVNSFYNELQDSTSYVYDYSGASNPKLGFDVNEELNSYVKDQILLEMIVNSGITISAGLKRKTQSTWSDDAVKKSLTPEAITIAIDYMWGDKANLIKSVKKEVDSRLTLIKSTTKKEVELA